LYTSHASQAIIAAKQATKKAVFDALESLRMSTHMKQQFWLDIKLAKKEKAHPDTYSLATLSHRESYVS
jgi:hypothetical protein